MGRHDRTTGAIVPSERDVLMGVHADRYVIPGIEGGVESTFAKPSVMSGCFTARSSVGIICWVNPQGALVVPEHVG